VFTSTRCDRSSWYPPTLLRSSRTQEVGTWPSPPAAWSYPEKHTQGSRRDQQYNTASNLCGYHPTSHGPRMHNTTGEDAPDNRGPNAHRGREPCVSIMSKRAPRRSFGEKPHVVLPGHTPKHQVFGRAELVRCDRLPHFIRIGSLRAAS